MNFRFYANTVSKVSQKVATGIFIVGMLLIGFGFLIWVLRELFAILFAIVFSVIGIGCLVTAVKIFWGQRKFNRFCDRDSDDSSRENVRIHVRRD